MNKQEQETPKVKVGDMPLFESMESEDIAHLKQTLNESRELLTELGLQANEKSKEIADLKQQLAKALNTIEDFRHADSVLAKDNIGFMNEIDGLEKQLSDSVPKSGLRSSVDRFQSCIKKFGARGNEFDYFIEEVEELLKDNK